jgi:hypothetical protein
MTKRNREQSPSPRGGPDDDTIDDFNLEDVIKHAVTTALSREKKRRHVSTSKPQGGGDNENEVALDPDALCDRYNIILGKVIDERGFEYRRLAEDLVRFSAVISYPNDVDLPLQRKAMEVEGSAWVEYDCSTKGKMQIMIFNTKNQAMQLQNASETERMEMERRDAVAEKVKEYGRLIPGEKGRLLQVLCLNASVDTTRLPVPVPESKTVARGINVLTARVLVDSPARGRDMELIAAAQGNKFRAVKLGPHRDEAKLCLVVEITSGTEKVPEVGNA